MTYWLITLDTRVASISLFLLTVVAYPNTATSTVDGPLAAG